jgi:uncharacterized protein YjgD (DUF1641 family)
MRAVKGLIEDLAPVPDKIAKETLSTVRELRERFEKDETLTLIKRIGDNIPTFVELLDTMRAVKGLIEDLAPVPDKIAKETLSTVRELRERFEKDETLTLIKRIGDNIPTFVELLDTMRAVKGLIEDLAPVPDKIAKETLSTVRELRERFEKDETLQLVQKTGENINAFNKLLDCLAAFDKSGDLDFMLENVQAKETRDLIKGMEKCAVKTMQQVMEKPIKPGLSKLIFAMRDPEIQKGLLFLTTFARNIPQCLETTKDSLEQ